MPNIIEELANIKKELANVKEELVGTNEELANKKENEYFDDDVQVLANKTLLVPIIEDFSRAFHTHSAPSSGGTIDHGGLSGLTDDDHIQYSRVDGTRAYTDGLTGTNAWFTGSLSAVTISATTVCASDIKAITITGTTLSGTTLSATIIVLNNGVSAIAVADAIKMWSADCATGDARLYIQSELGYPITVGNNGILFYDTALTRDGAADTLALKRGTNRQQFNIYRNDGTWSEYAYFYWMDGEEFTIGNSYIGSAGTGTQSIYIRPWGSIHLCPNQSPAMLLDTLGNVMIGPHTTFGSGAQGVLGLVNGTAPTTAPVEMVQIWSANYVSGGTGDARLYLLSESGDPIIIGNDSIIIPNVLSTTITATTLSATTLSATNVYATTLTGETLVSTVVVSAIDVRATTITATNVSATNVSATSITATTFSGTALCGTTISATNYLNIPIVPLSEPLTAITMSATTFSGGDIKATTITGTTLSASVVSAADVSGVGASAGGTGFVFSTGGGSAVGPGGVVLSADHFLVVTVGGTSHYIAVYNSAGLA